MQNFKQVDYDIVISNKNDKQTDILIKILQHKVAI